MRKSLVNVLIATIALGLGAVTLQAADRGDQFNDKVHRVNDLSKKQMESAEKAVSVETGVPVEEVRAMHSRYNEVGLAGILVSSVLADETKKKPEEFLHQHASGKSWTKMAEENHVPMDKLNARLDHLERYLASGDQNRTRERRHKD